MYSLSLHHCDPNLQLACSGLAFDLHGVNNLNQITIFVVVLFYVKTALVTKICLQLQHKHSAILSLLESLQLYNGDTKEKVFGPLPACIIQFMALTFFRHFFSFIIMQLI